MATNGSKSLTVTSWDTLNFNWWQVNQSVANNTTTIGWSLQLIATSSGRISSTASKDWSVTINGTKYSGTNTVGIANNATKTLASGQTVIAHNADGTKSFSFSFSQEFGINFGGSTIGTKSGSGTGTLNTIPRATTPTLSASSVDMGGSVTIYTTRASTSFKHDLAYSFAGSAFQTFATNVETWYAWAVPDLATSIPNATSGTLTIRCTTKNGGTTIGTKTVLLTIKVPASVVPTISSVTATEATEGLAAQFGAFIQGKSAIKAVITAAGAKGSTIKSYSTTFAGKTYTGSSWASDPIGSSGTLELVTVVTDSRGRTAKKTTSISVLAYAPPKVYAFSASRRNASGEADTGGNRIAVYYKYAVTALNNKNTAALVVEYKRSTVTSWSTLLTGSALSADTTQSPSSPTFSSDYQYDLRLTVTDFFGASSVYTATLPSGAVILDIKADGLGIAFGKTADKEGADFGWSPKGAVLGLWEATAKIPDYGDFNEWLTPGVYAVSTDNTAKTLENRPCDLAGTLRVHSAIGNKNIAGDYAYIFQEYRPYRSTCPAWTRSAMATGDGVWEFEDWVPDGGLENFSIAWASGVNVSYYTLSRSGGVVCLSASFSVTGAITAGTTKVVGSIPEELRVSWPVLTLARYGTNGTTAVAARSNGELIVTPFGAYTSGSSIMFTLTWNTSATWK